ncbi:MAG: twin-arginine translocation signal domain-containing protein, partial [Candidatus Acidiferrales bacterium]
MGPQARSNSKINRRSFLGRVVGGAAATAAVAVLADPVKASTTSAFQIGGPDGVTKGRVV